MASLPPRPPSGPPLGGPPLPPGWTEHTAPTGHTYYYNEETKKSTYSRPLPDLQGFPPPPAVSPTPPALAHSPTPSNAQYSPYPAGQTFTPNFQQQNFQYGGPPQQGFPYPGPSQPFIQNDGRSSFPRGGHRGGQRNISGRKPQPAADRPKHRYDIPNCTPWVLVKTKLGRRFVWNKETNESFWKFPPDVMKGVIEFDRMEREKRERRARGEPSDDEENAMAEVEAELAAAEEEIETEVVEVDGGEGMEEEEEYEEVEVTDDEGEEAQQSSKRQRTEEPLEDQRMEMGEDDIAWQLAAMEDQYMEEEEEGLPLTEEDCKILFKELLDDTRVSPYTPWDKILEDGMLYEDERYKALPNMKARKECFDEWAREKVQQLKEQKAKQQKLDPRIPYLALLQQCATPKLYWPEFRRKYKKEPEMKDQKLPDKEKEKLYREHVKRMGMKQADLRSDLSAMLKAQPLATLNRSTTIDTLPANILTDLRYVSLPASIRDSLIETYISTLPAAPKDAAATAEEEAEAAKKQAERDRREKALADRERRVQEDKRRQERELAYGKGRLREEEIEIERAMKVGKEGLRAQLEALGKDDQIVKDN